MLYNIFGSADSIDTDIMVLVHSLPSIEECKNLCASFEQQFNFESKLGNKEFNVNLAIVKDGVIVDCFKGSPDECNNAIFYTYKLHQQFCPCLVDRIVPRDIELKIARSVRELLSFLSRTEHREEIKRALKGSFREKLDTLHNIDISLLNDLGKNNQTLADFYKTVAFQIGQCLPLLSNLESHEFYTKSEIANYCPILKPALYRDESLNKQSIENVKLLFVNMLKDVYKDRELVEHKNWRQSNDK